MTEERRENARELGLDPDRLLRVTRAIEEDTARGLYDGATVLVARYGAVVLHEAIGHSDLAAKHKAKKDDVFFVMSITKIMTTAVVLSFIEQGKMDLTTKVAEVIPEFGVRGKQRVAVWHLLTHTGGMSAELPPMLPVEQAGNLQAYVAAACDEPLRTHPGKRVSYSPFTAHAVLAEMVRRLDGGSRPFRQILAEDLFTPLGMRDTCLGVRKDLQGRIVPVVVRDTTPGLFNAVLLESMNEMITDETEVPAGGAVSTAWDLYRMAEMLRRGGELDGVRVLSPAMIELATSNHTGLEPNDIFDHAREIHGWDSYPAYLGLSFFLRGEGVFPTPFGIMASPETFGGLGAGSTVFWVDPERDLSLVLLTAGLLEEGTCILRHQRLSDMVIAAVVE